MARNSKKRRDGASTRPALNRRNFLRGAGGAALALPFLEIFAGDRRVMAAPPSGHPQRFITMFHHQGTIPSRWKPTGSGADFQLSPLLSGLEAHREQLLILAGIGNRASSLNVGSDGHVSPETTLYTCEAWDENIDGQGGVLPGTEQASWGGAGGASIDQVLAARIGDDTPYRSVDLGIGNHIDSRSPTVDTRMFWSGRGQPVTSVVDPVETLSFVFGGGGGGGSEQLARLMARRLSVLDAVSDNFSSLRGRLGAEDRMRLDAHAAKVRQLEQQLQSLGTCEPPSLELGPNYDFVFDDDVSARVQIDLLVLAMACGLTRVGTLAFVDGHGNPFRYITDPDPVTPTPPAGWEGDPDVDPPEFGYSNWHDMIHRGLNDTEGEREQGRQTEPGIDAVMRFFAGQFQYLLDQLAATPDPQGQTLLDSSLVAWTSEFGNAGMHWVNRLPVVLAGNMGPDVAMGRFVDWEGGEEWEFGEYCTNQLWTSVLQAFGESDQSFGRTGSYTLTDTWGDVRHVELPEGPLPLSS